MLHKTKFDDKGNGVQIASSGGISDTTLMGVATDFRNRVSRKYRTLPARLLDTTFASIAQIIASVKYDGEGVFVYFDDELNLCLAFNAPSGRTRIGLPCLEKAKTILKAKGHKKGLFTAEIYLQSKPGERTRVSDVIHITSSGTAEERESLALAFYDVVMLDGKDLRDNQRSFKTTWDLLGTLFGEDPTQNCHRVEGQILTGKDITAWFQKVTEERGLEGVVIKLLDNETTYKIKPSLSIDCVALGYVEGDFEDKYGVLSILCGLTAPDGKTIQALCRVGSGFTDAQREEFLPALSSLKTADPLQMTDTDGRPIHFVEPKIVVEVEGEALQETDLAGNSIASQTLQWDGKTLEFKGMANAGRLTHATFVRLREDKVWNDGGTRMEQALAETAIAAILKPAKIQSTKPEIIIREVYTKVTKGETSIRKIVVTERHQPGFATWTIHWTDFSASRKDPLKTDTRIAESTERLEAILIGFREEASKKGWTKVGDPTEAPEVPVAA